MEKSSVGGANKYLVRGGVSSANGFCVLNRSDVLSSIKEGVWCEIIAAELHPTGPSVVNELRLVGPNILVLSALSLFIN